MRALRRVNCNGCGRFMIEEWASVGPGGATRCYLCEHCNRETVIDDPEDDRRSGDGTPPVREKKPRHGAAAIAFLLFAAAAAGCGSVSTIDVDGGADARGGTGGASAGGRGGSSGGDGGELGGRGGSTITPDAGSDGSTSDGGPAVDAGADRCPPPAFSCLGVRGGCAQGEEAATLTTCSVAAPLCCPAHVCDPAQCHTCTGCP